MRRRPPMPLVVAAFVLVEVATPASGQVCSFLCVGARAPPNCLNRCNPSCICPCCAYSASTAIAYNNAQSCNYTDFHRTGGVSATVSAFAPCTRNRVCTGSAGEVEIVAPTLTSDRQCILHPCLSGTHGCAASTVCTRRSGLSFSCVSGAPTFVPTANPTSAPSVEPTARPTVSPTAVPTAAPTPLPTALPSVTTLQPTATPPALPTELPTATPTAALLAAPTSSISGGGGAGDSAGIGIGIAVAIAIVGWLVGVICIGSIACQQRRKHTLDIELPLPPLPQTTPIYVNPLHIFAGATGWDSEVPTTSQKDRHSGHPHNVVSLSSENYVVKAYADGPLDDVVAGGGACAGPLEGKLPSAPASSAAPGSSASACAAPEYEGFRSSSDSGASPGYAVFRSPSEPDEL
eukprot:m.11661 g.11661  ORF g.11661 m.11661 type:complete len:405 (-) comp7463_c0_seq1:259-1473(-)